MGIITTLILGGLIGWLASIVMLRDAQLGIFGNIVVGMLGAVLANLFIAPLLGYHATVSGIDLVGLFIAFLGACGVLAIVNLFTRRSVR